MPVRYSDLTYDQSKLSNYSSMKQQNFDGCEVKIDTNRKQEFANIALKLANHNFFLQRTKIIKSRSTSCIPPILHQKMATFDFL